MRLKEFLKSKSELSLKEDVRFDLREYQISGARKSSRLLSKRRNVVVDLPTGAGKTNLALILTALIHFSHSWTRKKILYVVPTRVLIGQVARAAKWLVPEIYRVGVQQELTANTFNLSAAIERADLIITTPGLFASLLRTGAVNRNWFNENLACVVIDEFDEFLTIDATRTGFRVRFEQALARLLDQLHSAPFLLMSGTAPKLAQQLVQSETAQLFAEFIDKQMKPVELGISEDEYREYIPEAVVHFIGVADDFVAACNSSLNYQQQSALMEFRCTENIDLDRGYLMERLNVIARGLVNSVRCTDGRFVAVTPSMVGLCWRLLSIVQKYTFLFEDMFAHFDVEIRRMKVQVDCGEYRVINVPFLIDERASDEFWPQLCAKSNTLLRLVTRRDNERGVIFTRNVRLSDVLEKLFQQNRIPVLKLDGRLSSKIRFDQLRQFDALTNGVLIITRTTGKRGLDIPFADYAVLYSPKEDEYVMWQELSRIRGTLNSSKDSYILFYESTAEEEKLLRLREDMDHSANRYVFVEN